MFTKILLLLALFVTAVAPLAGAEEINPVLGKVGDFTIRETDLDRLIAAQPPQTQQQLQEKPELKVNFVRELLVNRAIAAKARKEGLDRKPEFRERLAYLIDSFLSNEYLAKVVLADIRITDEDLRAFYKEHAHDFGVEATVKARHIHFKLAATAPAEEQEKARTRAAAALARLKQGEDFARVAAEVSEDSDTAKSGGELGVIAAGKTNSAEFETAVFALKKGELSGIVTTPFGLHIIRVDDRSEQRTATFEEMRPYIEAQLKREKEQQKGEAFLAGLLKESGLEVYAERLGAAGSTPQPAKKAD